MRVIYAMEQLSTSNRMSVTLVFTQWMTTLSILLPSSDTKDLGQCVTKAIKIFRIFTNIHDWLD
jgi:hypothetical protein